MMNALRALRDFIRNRRVAYQKTFLVDGHIAPYAQEVLHDLALFCRAYESTFHKDPRAHAVLEGRREVWIRIQNHLHLTDDQLLKLHAPAAAQAASTSQENPDA